MGDQYITNPLSSLHQVVVFDSRDWASNQKDAWIYGIIVGWNGEDKEENESLFQEFNSKFGWERTTWNRLLELHKKYELIKQENY
jgi:hypothetical protein